jgi:hypothetical protein
METFYQKAEFYAKPTVNSCLVLGSDSLSTNLPPFRVKTSPTIHVRRAAVNTEPTYHFYASSEK